MNIRKFTGATSRDALRLVREALGADAVVLSNRTLDDGSVEIVALADSDLAAVTPPAAARARMAAPRVPESVPAAAVPGIVSRPGAALARPAVNPYAAGEGGLPDVFSSVFGASADADADSGSDDSAAQASTLDADPLAGATAAGASVTGAPAATSEPAPWLVEHAKRLTQQRDALMARTQAAPAAPQPSPPAPQAAASATPPG
ncbi:flagellar biosynthesis protein FlhF, partial [Burkholderia cepacia]|nr:flagellar biosynthesis protein FlhF [Burkholderia cepacia]